MTSFDASRSAAVLGAAVLIFAGTGCATKKHVRNVVGPVEARVSQTEKRNTEQQAAIGELGNSVSRADERAQEADRKAAAAGESASKANEAASRAGEAAQSARSRADEGYTLAESTRARLGQLSENIDNYKMVTAENVLFGTNKWQLTNDAKAQLDSAAAQIQNSKNYVLEIQGFTDSTGNANSNLELSRKRADSVVRYLTVKHNIPLRKINVLGVGSDDPQADNKTRDGRKAARRVEMRVFALDLGGQQNAGNSNNSMNIPRQTGSAARTLDSTTPSTSGQKTPVGTEGPATPQQ